MAYLEGHIIIKRVGHIMHRYEAVHGGTDEAAAAVEAHLNAQMHEEGGGGRLCGKAKPFFHDTMAGCTDPHGSSWIPWLDARTLTAMTRCMEPHCPHPSVH